MAEGIITPITSDGTIIIPRELMEKFNIKDRVEIVETHCSKGILIKALNE
jgi:bifunctional DNA-binding transcriptional regulator/antitoxin component of YhaV-PrlF toxin-antitoxin module